MSVVVIIVGENSICLGCDGQLTSDSTKYHYGADIKLIEYGDLIIGFAGDVKISSLLKIFISDQSNHPQSNGESGILDFINSFSKFTSINSNIENKLISECSLIIVFKGEAYLFDDYEIRKYVTGDFDAIGSGRPYALAALHLDHGIDDSISAACHLDLYCDYPTKIRYYSR